MPTNVFGSSSRNVEIKLDTSSVGQKPYLRTNYIESNFEEDIDLKYQFKNKILPFFFSLKKLLRKCILIINSAIHL